jgi:hypothetical protein
MLPAPKEKGSEDLRTRIRARTRRLRRLWTRRMDLGWTQDGSVSRDETKQPIVLLGV